MRQEIRVSFRQLTHRKSLSAAIILLLALGTGANAIIFQFVNAVLLRPLPVRDPANLFLIEKMRAKQIRPETACSYRVYEKIAARSDLFLSAVAAQEWLETSFQPWQRGDSVRMISIQIVSPNYFSDLAIRTILGRPLTAADAKVTSDIPIVVSYRFWTAEMNRNPHVIGRVIRIKEFPFRVVGVLASDFHDLDIDRSPDVRLPVSAARFFVSKGAPDVHSLPFQILVRLRPGKAPAAAAEAITRAMQETDAEIMRALFAEQSTAPGKQGQTLSPEQLEQMVRLSISYRVHLLNVEKGLSRLRDQFASALSILISASGLLWLAVCASVAGLLLARVEGRRRELAICMALGATRRQLLRQTLSDLASLALPSSFLALLLARLLAPVLMRILPKVRGLLPLYPTDPVMNFSLDHRAWSFALMLCVLTVILSGMGPAWRTLQIDINDNLRRDQESGRKTILGLAVVSLQIGLCVVLLFGAALMMRTFWNLQHLNPGFDRAHIIEVDLNPAAVGYSAAQSRQLLRELRAQATGLPGVRSAASAVAGVMHGVGMKTTLVPEGAAHPEAAFMNVNTDLVTPEYFQTMGIPLLAGELLEAQDSQKQAAPAVINQALADALFPHQNPIGRRLMYYFQGKLQPSAVVKGVVGTAKYRSLREVSAPIVYTLDVDALPARILYVRTFHDPAPLLGQLIKLIHMRDARLPILSVFTMEQEVQSSLWQERLLTLLCGFFALTAVGLALAGVYGVLAYSVATQRRAIGVRLALGATPAHVIRSVCAASAGAVAIGSAGGFLVTVLLTHWAQGLVFGVQTLDPASFLVSFLCILIISLGAAVIPVLRAIRTDPMAILRSE
jgi:predicted permease